MLVNKKSQQGGISIMISRLRGNTGYCRKLWREHTGIWCKRFWHWTTQQLYWQGLQLTAYRTHYTSILCTAATMEGYLLILCLSTVWSSFVMIPPKKPQFCKKQTKKKPNKNTLWTGFLAQEALRNLARFSVSQHSNVNASLQSLRVMCSPYSVQNRTSSWLNCTGQNKWQKFWLNKISENVYV